MQEVERTALSSNSTTRGLAPCRKLDQGRARARCSSWLPLPPGPRAWPPAPVRPALGAQQRRFAATPGEEQLLLNMLNDPGTSADRHDGTSAASTLARATGSAAPAPAAASPASPNGKRQQRGVASPVCSAGSVPQPAEGATGPPREAQAAAAAQPTSLRGGRRQVARQVARQAAAPAAAARLIPGGGDDGAGDAGEGGDGGNGRAAAHPFGVEMVEAAASSGGAADVNTGIGLHHGLHHVNGNGTGKTSGSYGGSSNNGASNISGNGTGSSSRATPAIFSSKRAVATRYLTMELLLLPPEELEAQLLTLWRSPTWLELSTPQKGRHVSEAGFRLRDLEAGGWLGEQLPQEHQAQQEQSGAEGNRRGGESPELADRLAAVERAYRTMLAASQAAKDGGVAEEGEPGAGLEQHGGGKGRTRADGFTLDRNRTSTGAFVSVATAYINPGWLLAACGEAEDGSGTKRRDAGAALLTAAVALQMQRWCSSADSLKHHTSKAHKALQALAAERGWTAWKLNARLAAVTKAQLQARAWMETAALLSKELLAAPPEEMRTALLGAWRRKRDQDGVQLAAVTAVAVLRQLVVDGQHPAPQQLGAQLAEVRTAAMLRSPNALMAQLTSVAAAAVEPAGATRGGSLSKRKMEAAAGLPKEKAPAVEVLADLLREQWRGRSPRGICEAAREAEEALVAAFCADSLDRPTLQPRLEAVAAAKASALQDFTSAGPPQPSQPPGAAAAAGAGAHGEAGADGAGGADAAVAEGEGEGEAYTRTAYVTLALVLRPPEEVCAAVMAAAAGPGHLLRRVRYHNRKVKDQALWALELGLLDQQQLDALNTALDALKPDPPAAAPSRGGRVSVVQYLNPALLLLPPDELRAALQRHWQAVTRTRDSTRYHSRIAQQRLAELYGMSDSSGGSGDGGVVGDAEGYRRAVLAVREAERAVMEKFYAARQKRLLGEGSEGEGSGSDDAGPQGEVVDTEQAASSVHLGTEEGMAVAAARTAAATAAGFGVGLEGLSSAELAARLGMRRAGPVPAALLDPLLQHMVRSDLPDYDRASQLADHMQHMDAAERGRLLLSVRRKLDRCMGQGLLQPERAAVGDEVSKAAVVILQLRGYDDMQRLLAATREAAATEDAGGGGGEGPAGGSAQVSEAEAAVTAALAAEWAELHASEKNRRVQNMRRNLRRALEVGMASGGSVRRAERLLRRVALQAHHLRSGLSQEDAVVAAKADEVAAEAVAVADEVAIPGAAFWLRAAADSAGRLWAEESLVAAWQPLGPTVRKAFKRRILNWLDRAAEAGELDQEQVKVAVQVMRAATLAMARHWRQVMQTVTRAAASNATMEAGTDTDMQADDEGEGTDEEWTDEEAEGAEESEGGGGPTWTRGRLGTGRGARSKSRSFVRGLQLAEMEPQAMREPLRQELLQCDYQQRKYLLERLRESLRARFDGGHLAGPELRDRLAVVTAVSLEVGKQLQSEAGKKGMAERYGRGAEAEARQGEDEQAAAGGTVDERRFRRMTTHKLTPDEEAALPAALEAISEERLLQVPPEQLTQQLTAAWVALDGITQSNHHSYARARLRNCVRTGKLDPEGYGTRLAAMVTAGRIARAQRDAKLAQRGVKLARLEATGSAARAAMGAAGAGEAVDDGGGEAGSGLSLAGLRAELLAEFEAGPAAYVAATAAAAAAAGGQGSVLVLPADAGVAAGWRQQRQQQLEGSPEEVAGDDADDHAAGAAASVVAALPSVLTEMLGVAPKAVLRVWAALPYRPFKRAYRDNLQLLRKLSEPPEYRAAAAVPGASKPPPLLTRDQFEAAATELAAWYEEATLLRRQFSRAALSRSLSSRGAARRSAILAASAASAAATAAIAAAIADDRAAAGAVDSDAAAAAATLSKSVADAKDYGTGRLGVTQQEFFRQALVGRLIVAGADLSEPPEPPPDTSLLQEGGYGRRHKAVVTRNPRHMVLAQEAAAARAAAVVGAEAAGPMTAEELVAVGEAAEAELDERSFSRLVQLLQEVPSPLELLAPGPALRANLVAHFTASGGLTNLPAKTAALARVRRRLDQLLGWGVIGVNKHAWQLSAIMSVSSAWPHIARGAAFDTATGALPLSEIHAADELYSQLRALDPQQLQLWLMERWRRMGQRSKQKDANMLRWRIGSLERHGTLGAEEAEARRRALTALSSRWQYVVEEGWSLEEVNQAQGKRARGAGRPRGSAQANRPPRGTGVSTRGKGRSRAAAAGDGTDQDLVVGATTRRRADLLAGAAGTPRRAAATRRKAEPKPEAGSGGSRMRRNRRMAKDADDADDEGDEEAVYRRRGRPRRVDGQLVQALEKLGLADAAAAARVLGSDGGEGQQRERWWETRATLPAEDAATSQAPPVPAAPPVPDDVLAKVARLSELARRQRSHLFALQGLQLSRAGGSSSGEVTAATNGHAAVLGAGRVPAVGAAGLQEALAAAKATLETVESRLAQWRSLLPAAALGRLDELDRLAQEREHAALLARAEEQQREEQRRLQQQEEQKERQQQEGQREQVEWQQQQQHRQQQEEAARLERVARRGSNRGNGHRDNGKGLVGEQTEASPPAIVEALPELQPAPLVASSREPAARAVQAKPARAPAASKKRTPAAAVCAAVPVASGVVAASTPSPASSAAAGTSHAAEPPSAAAEEQGDAAPVLKSTGAGAGARSSSGSSWMQAAQERLRAVTGFLNQSPKPRPPPIAPSLAQPVAAEQPKQQRRRKQPQPAQEAPEEPPAAASPDSHPLHDLSSASEGEADAVATLPSAAADAAEPPLAGPSASTAAPDALAAEVGVAVDLAALKSKFFSSRLMPGAKPFVRPGSAPEAPAGSGPQRGGRSAGSWARGEAGTRPGTGGNGAGGSRGGGGGGKAGGGRHSATSR